MEEVKSIEEIIQRVRAFNKLKSNDDTFYNNKLTNIRKWVGLLDSDTWIFAPHRWVAFTNMTIHNYSSSENKNDVAKNILTKHLGCSVDSQKNSIDFQKAKEIFLNFCSEEVNPSFNRNNDEGSLVEFWLVQPQYITVHEEDELRSLYVEGATIKVLVNAYERNAKARAACIKYHKDSCKACGFNFKEIYGERGAEYIQVHHIKPISEIGEKYQVDPIKDLIPVCSNCHAMIHRVKGDVLTIESLKDIIQQNKYDPATQKRPIC